MKHNKIIFFILFCLLLSGCTKECIHEYQSQISLPASCTQEGVETFTCALCQDSYTKAVPVLEHSYTLGRIAKEPTCSEEGLQEYACIHCGATKSEPIEKLAHTFGELTVTKEPNCTEEGERSGTCTVCGTSQVVEKIATNDVHVFTNTVIREATCTDPGEGMNVCSLCQHSESCQYELKAHTYGNAEIIANATCTNTGTKQFVCTECGHTVTETIAATGHKWTGATCTNAGVCAMCGVTGSKANHNYAITTIREFSTHYAGQRVKKCRDCNNEVLEYYTKLYTYDLNAIAAEIAAYTTEKGFVPAIEEFHDYTKCVFHGVWESDLSKYGPDGLVEEAKKTIDYIYMQLTDNCAILGKRTMHIYVYYTESSSFGGFFGVYMKTSFYE